MIFLNSSGWLVGFAEIIVYYSKSMNFVDVGFQKSIESNENTGTN